MTKTQTIRFPEEIYNKVMEHAHEECRDFSKQVIWILKQYISQAEKNQLLP